MYNLLAYKKRYGGSYKTDKLWYAKNAALSRQALRDIQKERYSEFINYVLNHSSWYKKRYQNISNPSEIENIKKLPILTKRDIQEAGKSIHTIPFSTGVVSKTGGTTGTSLQVVFTKRDMQERFAMLDTFREKYGYKLGKKTAWFSGKSLLSKRDFKKKIYWKKDYLYNIKYYSTFHINEESAMYYLNNLASFSPEYIVGFPSSLMDIIQVANKKDLKYTGLPIKAIFPTAETITETTRITLESFFSTKVKDQYASSEGAPFIFECSEGKLHLELQSGVFEVLNEKNEDSNKGRLVVTSFTTKGTPLIRYDIGDAIELSSQTCNCGNNNPVVKEILGRKSDFLFSKQTGKLYLGNMSNALKGVSGVAKIQFHQKIETRIDVYLVVNSEFSEHKSQKRLIHNLRERLGNEIEISVQIVDHIPNEKSGKFRMIKNTLHLE